MLHTTSTCEFTSFFCDAWYWAFKRTGTIHSANGHQVHSSNKSQFSDIDRFSLPSLKYRGMTSFPGSKLHVDAQGMSTSIKKQLQRHSLGQTRISAITKPCLYHNSFLWWIKLKWIKIYPGEKQEWKTTRVSTDKTVSTEKKKFQKGILLEQLLGMHLSHFLACRMGSNQR